MKAIESVHTECDCPLLRHPARKGLVFHDKGSDPGMWFIVGEQIASGQWPTVYYNGSMQFVSATQSHTSIGRLPHTYYTVYEGETE